MTDESTKESRKRSVRSKAKRHLRRLVMAGTAGGAAALQLGACTVVCDPMPSPLECPVSPGDQVLRERLSASATWESSNPGWNVSVRLHLYRYSGDDPLIFTGPPEVTDATLLRSTVADDELTFTCAVQDASTIAVTVPTSCDGDSSSIQLQMDVSGLPSEGHGVPIGF